MHHYFFLIKSEILISKFVGGEGRCPPPLPQFTPLIQTDLKPLKKLIILMTHLGLAETFKTMNRPNPTRPDPTVMLFVGLYLRKNKR